MFQLERVSIHNWYILEDRDIEVSGSVALIGPTGAGKSAIVDAIQTVMSGSNRNVFKLNKAAGEVSDRHVKDYCLGCVTDVDNGRPMRQSSDTVLALTFARQDTGARVAFGLLLSAHADESDGERKVHRFVIKGQGFRLSDFVEVEPGGARFMPGHDAMLGRMKDRFGIRRDALTWHATARAFVQEYLTAMRPKASPDPHRFLNTFSNALAAREIKDPTDFVRRFVLEPNPLNIKRVRESITTWRELQAEAHRLEKMLHAAREVRSRFIGWARQKLTKDGAGFLAIHAERLRLEIELRENEASRDALKTQRRGIENRELELSDENARLNDENRRDALIAAQSETAISRQLLTSAVLEAQRAKDAGTAQLSRLLTPYLGAVQLGRLKEYLPARASQGVHAAAALAGITASGKPECWASRWAEIGALAASASALVHAGQSLQPQDDAVSSDLAGWRRELTDLDMRIAATNRAGALMGTQTIRLRQELSKRGIAAAAMPDVVEVPDGRWAFALEALLGAYREALIVHADRLDEAFQVLFRNRGQLEGCRLVNTRKTRTSQARVPAGSIAEAAMTENPDARAFIDAYVGRYVRAENEHDLSRLDHGIMANGKTSQGLGVRVYRDRPPILGQTAQAAAREAATARRDEIASLITAGENRKALLQSGLRALAALAAAASPNEIEVDARALADAVERLASAERRSGELDQADPDGIFEGMRARDQRVFVNKKEVDGLRRRAAEADQTLGRLAGDWADKLDKSSRLLARESELSSAQATERERKLIEMSASEPIALVRERLENKLLLDWRGREVAELRREEAAARQLSTDSNSQIAESLRRADGMLRNYLLTSERAGTLSEDTDEGDKLIWIDGRVARIETHELLPHRQRLEEVRGEMERMLKEDLLAKLDERLQGAGRQIDILNRRLKNHRFVGQTYSFNKRPNERMRPLAELARHVALDPRLDFEALQRAELPPMLRSALDDIERIVGTDADVADIEDYRTYYEYDLLLRQGEEKPVSFASVLGKLSGGQREAPYYVAIAASMVSVYYPGGRAGDTDGMGLVLFDEAFKHLDPKNTLALLDLFRELGLQVVVAAPEMHRTTFLEGVDTIVTVARQPGTADIYLDVMQPGPKARAAMRAANPNHVGIAGFRTAPTPPDTVAAD